jgi:LacI family transcriptional regulator
MAAEPDLSMRAVTLRDVADLAGVSSATASRALAGSTRPMDETLRQRVLDAAAELRYVSNGPAQALARKTTSVVGLIVHDVNDPYYSALASGAMEVAREHNLLVMMASTHREAALQADYVSRLRAQRARAILLAGGLDEEGDTRLSEELKAFAEQGGRVVAISSHTPGLDTIAPGNEEGGREVARLLHRLGHRTVGVVTGPARLVSVQDRLRGFLDEGAQLGIDVDNSQWAQGDFTREGGRAATLQMFESAHELTAVFALNDLMAVGVLWALRDDLGRSVPGDVSVVGFDDTPAALDVTPALTTVRLPLDEIGRSAMQLALDTGRAEAVELSVPCQLIERSTTAAIAPPIS